MSQPEISIEKFYHAPWCSDCKRTKQFLGEQRIHYDHALINVDENEDAAKEVERINNGKRKIPTLIFSDGTTMTEPSNAELAQKLGIVQELDHDTHDLIIVGGGPAGLTTALYAARDGYDVVVIERGSLGGQASYTERIENYPGFPEGIGGGELADRIVQQCQRNGVEFLRATDVVDFSQVHCMIEVETSVGRKITGKAMLVSTGSKYRRLGVTGEDDLIGYKIHFCATCDGPFYKGEEVVVVGGGDSAFEEALFLAGITSKVTILVRSTIKASKTIQDKVEETSNIEVLTNTMVMEFLVGAGKSLDGVKINQNSLEQVIHPAGVFIFVGLDPNIQFLHNKIKLSSTGFIETDYTLRTNVRGIYAAGDVRFRSTKQAVAAMGEGAAAALAIREYLQSEW